MHPLRAKSQDSFGIQHRVEIHIPIITVILTNLINVFLMTENSAVSWI